MMGFGRKTEKGAPPKLEGLTIEMIVKFKTNYKLNLFSKTGDKLISNKDAKDEEVHFVKFEGMYPEFELSPDALRKSMQNFAFSDWTIVDFDNFLKGNPHI